MTNTLKRFDHVERMHDQKLAKKMHRSKVEGSSERITAGTLGGESEGINWEEDPGRLDGDGAC